MATGICPFCGKKVDKFIMFRGDIVGCRYCGIHTKQTNADRIRAMTDEELAEWFIKVQDDIADYCDWGRAYPPELPTRKDTWIDWLKQEVKEDR